MTFTVRLLSIFAAIFSNNYSAVHSNEIQPKSQSGPVSPVSGTYTCPPGARISQINANLGAILDRINFRCNKSPWPSLGDIGTPIGYVTSPKANAIKTPNLNRGWDTMRVGYQYYAPKDREVVVSVQVCQGAICYETGFFYGLTICSADPTKEYKCKRIETFVANPGKCFNGITTTYIPERKTGYVISLAPLATADNPTEAETPTVKPTKTPTIRPTTATPSIEPTTVTPSMEPTTATPSMEPTTATPSMEPTTATPSIEPTALMTEPPSREATETPSVVAAKDENLGWFWTMYDSWIKFWSNLF